MEIIDKIFAWYKDLYLFGADKGFRFAFWLKKVLSKIDLVINMTMDLLVIAFNIILIFLWFAIYGNKLYILFPLLIICLHTIIVFAVVYLKRFSEITGPSK